MTVWQTDLEGRVVDRFEVQSEDVGILKSCLQKYVRRGLWQRAAFVACQLGNKKTGWSLWRRLSVISVEDVLDSSVIVAVSELERQAMQYGYESWDGRRCAVAAAFLLARCKKNRITDEFLEVCEMMQKHPDDEELAKKKAEWAKVEDYVLDCHTAEGKRMKRGERYWLETSSETTDKTPEYEAWRHWFKPLMLRLVKEE